MFRLSKSCHRAFRPPPQIEIHWAPVSLFSAVKWPYRDVNHVQYFRLLEVKARGATPPLLVAHHGSLLS